MSTRLAALNPQRLAREHDFLAAEKPPPPEQALLQAIEAAATAFRHLAAGPRSDAVRGIWILRVLAGRSAHDDARVQEALGELEWYGDRWASSLAEGTDTAAVIWGAGCDPPLPADPEDQAAVAVDLMQALNLDLSRLAVGSVERAKARADLAIRIHTAARGVSSLDWNTCQGRVQAYLDHLDDRLAHAGRDRILRLVAATADFEDPFAAGFAIGSNPSDLLDQSVWPDPDAPPDTSALT